MKKILVIIVILAVGGLGWFLFKRSASSEPEAESPKPVAMVETTPLADQAIAETVEAFGVVASAPSGDRVTSAPYDLVVRQVHVGVGSAVAAGDVLLDVTPSPEVRLAIDSARSAQALAAKNLAAAQERYDLKLATKPDLLAAQQAAEDARLKVDSLTLRGVDGDGQIRASAAGVVTRSDWSAGATVAAGTALITVSTGGEREARLGVETGDAGSVAVGQAVTLESANRTAPEKIASAIRAVGAVLDATTGAVEVRAPIPETSALLLGEHVRAEIEVRRKEHALVVPRSAVLPDDDAQVLFVVKNGKAVRHEVKLGLASGDRVEVNGAGLRAGDTVVTVGNYELEDGMAVQLAGQASGKNDEAGTIKPATEAGP